MAKRFERTLVAATESTVLETDWDLILDCVDQIRGGEVKARDAMGIVHKRLAHDNPHVQLHTLTLLEAVAKNCGKRVHVILATREFMETIKNLAIEAKAEPVKNKVLELLQCWAMAFANKPEYKIIVDTHNLMKLAGFDFPSVKEADAMFAAQVAPEWEEGDNCFRCRADFGLLTRKHHCRACGQIFCGSCSSKEMLLPQFGIEKPVRVCDACFEKGVGVALARQQSAVRKEPLPLPAGAKDPALEEKERQEQVQREKDEEEYQLQLAMAISQSEAEAKETERQHSLYSLYNGVKDQVAGSTRNASTPHDTSSIAPSEQIGIYKGAAESVRDSPSENSLNADDPLARYLNRDYWQQRKDKADAKVESWDINPSAPLPSEPSLGGGSCAPTIRGSPTPASKENVYNVAAGPTLDEDTIQKSGETMKFCSDIREQVESMENRLRSNVARGRPIYNDTAIQGLYMRLTELHSQVMHRMNELENQRTYFESLQDHLSHITEARAAVNALREEESRKRAEQAAEEQRLRQAQMQHKLAAMRQQKHDMLMYQRQLALQRFQQQEAEIAARRQQMQMGLPQQYYTAQPPAGAYSAQSAAVSSTQGGYMYGQVTAPQAANYGTYSPHPQNPQVPSSVVPAPQQQANYAQQPASTGQVVSGYAYPSQHSSVSSEQPIQAAHTIQQPGVYASGANSQPPHSQYVAAGYAPYASSQPTQANYEQSQVVPPQGYGQPSQIYQQAQYQQMQYQPQTTPQHSYPTPVNAQANYGTSSTQSTSSEVTTAKEEMLISFD